MNWHPHLMFFVAGDAEKSWGANLPGSPVMAADDPEERRRLFSWSWSANGPMGPRLLRTDRLMRSNVAVVALFFGILGALCAPAASPSSAPPIPIKVVIVTMFEAGADTGDRPGELQYWVERNHLDKILPFPRPTTTCA